MAGLYAPLPTLRRYPRGYRRTAWGQCGSLLLHCDRLAPSTPCRSPGAQLVDLMVGRLGLEPRTKALKGFYRRPMLSSRISQVSDLSELCLSMSSVVSFSFSVLFPYGLS